MVNRLEALVDAISNLRGSVNNPDGDLYQQRSPIGVMSFSMPGKNEIDEQSGRRIFKSWLAGYRAALFDLEKKVSGGSRAGIKSTDKLDNVLRVYSITEKLGQQQVVRFLRRALKDENIHTGTPLAYFRYETDDPRGER